MTTVQEQLAKHTERIPGSDCWIWKGAINQYGYGRVSVKRVNKHAHRVSYEVAKGQIPEGLVLDHLCRVRCCINPDHLEPVTIRENIQRGNQTNKGWKRNITHCPKGHEYTAQNTYLYRRANGKKYRVCKQCAKDGNAARKKGVQS